MTISNFFTNLFLPLTTTLFPINDVCEYYQQLSVGQEYYIYNPEYPDYYPGGIYCRWIAQSPNDTVIVVSCEDIDIPPTSDCSRDKLEIALDGNVNFAGSRKYCGKGNVTLITETNALAVALSSDYYSTGGRFLCAVTAIYNGPPPIITDPPSHCDCGLQQKTRIVGGNETIPNEFPLMAGMIDLKIRDFLCGATIISNRYALTAAHCVNNRTSSEFGLLVGDHNLRLGNDTMYAALYTLIGITQHPDYLYQTQENDIAVVKTNNTIVFNYGVGPACLPFKYSDRDFLAEQVKALGWGTLAFSGVMPDTLHQVNLDVISSTDCANELTQDKITPKHVCTYTPMKDACLSDSGGPLIWYAQSVRRWYLVGIISFGVGCAADLPAANTRVTAYLPWVVQVTSDAVYCIK